MQKSRVGPVQPIGDNVGMFSGPGFVVYDETEVRRRLVVRILQPRLLMQRMSPASVHKNRPHHALTIERRFPELTVNDRERCFAGLYPQPSLPMCTATSSSFASRWKKPHRAG
jgi:hypothetical protein